MWKCTSTARPEMFALLRSYRPESARHAGRQHLQTPGAVARLSRASSEHSEELCRLAAYDPSTSSGLQVPDKKARRGAVICPSNLEMQTQDSHPGSLASESLCHHGALSPTLAVSLSECDLLPTLASGILLDLYTFCR